MSDKAQDGTYRKRAPGQASDHPDWIVSLSGGIDSASAAILTYRSIETDRAGGNFAKKPFAVYSDTRIGNPLNHIYVEQLADWLGFLLYTGRTNEKFENQLEEEDAPGPSKHPETRNRVKLRQMDKLLTLAEDPWIVMGIAADESDDRASRRKITRKGRHVEVYPVHRVPRKRRVEIILRSDCPRNPLWEEPDVIADCGCLCNGDPSELDKTIEKYPEFGGRLKEWEEAYCSDKLEGNLGWGGLSAEEESLWRNDQVQTTLPFCSEGCNVERDPAEVRALKARREGASIEEAVSILYEEDDAPPEPALIPAADSGKPWEKDTEN